MQVVVRWLTLHRCLLLVYIIITNGQDRKTYWISYGQLVRKQSLGWLSIALTVNIEMFFIISGNPDRLVMPFYCRTIPLLPDFKHFPSWFHAKLCATSNLLLADATHDFSFIFFVLFSLHFLVRWITIFSIYLFVHIFFDSDNWLRFIYLFGHWSVIIYFLIYLFLQFFRIHLSIRFISW